MILINDIIILKFEIHFDVQIIHHIKGLFKSNDVLFILRKYQYKNISIRKIVMKDNKLNVITLINEKLVT